MNFIKLPNLPKKPVGLAIIDGRIDKRIEESLSQMGVNALKTCAHKDLYAAIEYHPDIMLHHLGEEYIIYAPGTSELVLEALKQKGFALIKGEKQLNPKYPDNIAYNVARIGGLAFHNFKYTDPGLVQELSRRGVKLVNVKQGYSKCSISIVDDETIITSDTGIAKAAKENGVDVLLIAPEKNILLPSLDHGFIGGCTGLLDKNKWVITGDLSTLSSAQPIKEFLTKRGVEYISLVNGNAIDIGSIIPLI